MNQVRRKAWCLLTLTCFVAVVVTKLVTFECAGKGENYHSFQRLCVILGVICGVATIVFAMSLELGWVKTIIYLVWAPASLLLAGSARMVFCEVRNDYLRIAFTTCPCTLVRR